MGASVDLVSEDLRRLIVNAAFFLTGQSVPDHADVAYVDPFYPSFYGFIRDKEHWPSLDMQPKDYGLGKYHSAPEPKGSPQWDYGIFRKNKSVFAFLLFGWNLDVILPELFQQVLYRLTSVSRPHVYGFISYRWNTLIG